MSIFFEIGGVMDSFTTLGFFFMSLFPYLTTVSVVVTNAFLEDMISVLNILYPGNYKIKVIFNSGET